MFPLPDFEQERLQILTSLGILDSETTAEFDAIVEHVRDLFEVPICLVSLVAKERQWFKANCGLEAGGTSRDVSFCAHAIVGTDVFVVEDALSDPRFSSNPLVTGEPHIRFYAGAPLIIQPGIALGTLCVIGREPRRITGPERLTLLRLAKVVTSLIQSHGLANQAIALAQQMEAQSLVMEAQRRELVLRERRFRQTEAIARVGGWELDLSTNSVSWSDEIYRIYDIEIGRPIDLELAVSAYPPTERQRLEVLIERTVRDGIPFDDEFEIETRRGARKWVRSIGDIEYVEGIPCRLFGTFQDVTQQHEEQKALWEIANKDTLTGLANRHRFNQLLVEAFMPPVTSVGLLMIDADHLKEVNDTLGHDAGDALIQCIAMRIKSAIRKTETVARIGGDEFAIIFADTSTADLKRCSEKIIEAIEPTLALFGTSVRPQVSIGGALSQYGDHPDILRQNADLALYRAKQTQRGGYVEFAPDMREAVNRRTCAISMVDAALNDNRIIPWYQPVIRLSDGRISAVEALARIQSVEGRIHSIGEYAEALDDHRTGARLTQKMLDRISADVTAWRDGGAIIPRIAINAGMPDFRRPDLYQRLECFARESGIDFPGLILEITETVFLSRNADDVTRTVNRLRDQGVIVALDDFGTGYASLSHLRSLPVDIIKLDRSFTACILEGGTDEAITASIVELAHKLGIEVVAEGVETEAQLSKLTEWGCHKVQGYLFSRPLPAKDSVDFIRVHGQSTAITSSSVQSSN